MKKGFTMIELIFVIVILGILASVAIPRLAGTREDAEISTAVANLRTLLSDAASYYVVKGSFTNAKWAEITSVPLKKDANGAAMDAATDALNAAGTATAYLKVGDVNDCIGVAVVNKNGDTPAYIKFTLKQGTASPGQQATTTTEGVCGKVLGSKPVKAYIDSVVKKADGSSESNAMAIGSNTTIYN